MSKKIRLGSQGEREGEGERRGIPEVKQCESRTDFTSPMPGSLRKELFALLGRMSLSFMSKVFTCF